MNTREIIEKEIDKWNMTLVSPPPMRDAIEQMMAPHWLKFLRSLLSSLPTQGTVKSAEVQPFRFYQDIAAQQLFEKDFLSVISSNQLDAS